MSYCRFSSEDYQCDVYCYEHCDGGFMVHLAGNKIVFTEPLPPAVALPSDKHSARLWYERHRKVGEIVDRSERVPIDLPHAGETLVEATAAECADRLERLRALGYRVPQYAIDTLRAEAAEEER